MILLEHPAGRPAQFVLSTPDPAAVADYYSAVFGWKSAADGTFTVGGEPVAHLVVTAGGSPRVSAAQLLAGRTGGQPEYNPVRGLPAGTPSEKLDPPILQTNLRRQPLAAGEGGWLPYLAVAELQSALATVAASGGTGQASDDGPLGRTAIVVDPTSTPLGLWEVGSGPAARLWGEDGAVVWVEQKTHDQQAATAFLSDLFGFEFVGPQGPGAVRVARVEAPLFGGVMQFDGRWAPDEAPHWLLYLQVADVDAAVESGTAAGGSVWFPPFDTPLGRMAYLRDPAGHAFAVVRLSENGEHMVGR